jgi:hypothetical protein
MGSVLAAMAPAFFIVTTIIGAVRWFSPVPFWDMWDGTVGFYVSLLQGAGISAFVEQANEHRIVLSKILFWIDYRYFRGLSYSLIAVNVALMFSLWLALCLAARSLMERRLAHLCSALIAIPCFSWLQAENINWGFQSQFYLAYLLPLLALMSMARWIHEPSTRRFITTIALGVVSTITMANGLLALPMLILMLALSGRCTRWHIVILIAATALTLAAWLHHYHAMPHPRAPIKQMIEFLLIFLGGPIGFLFHSLLLAMLAGAAVICAAAYLALQWVAGKTRNPMFLALVLFALHVGAAGAAASIGRTHFGLGAALAGRYETPGLLLYSALLLLFVHLYRDRISTSAVVGSLSVFVPLLLLLPQFDALDGDGPTIATQRMSAMLGIALGINDEDSISRVYASIDNLRHGAANAIRYNLSVFALPYLKSAPETIGRHPRDIGLMPCLGNIDHTYPIATDRNHTKLDGWVFDERDHRVPKIAFFVQDGIITGAAITGTRRPDVASAIDPGAGKSGFEGYAKVGPKPQIYCGN